MDVSTIIEDVSTETVEDSTDPLTSSRKEFHLRQLRILETAPVVLCYADSVILGSISNETVLKRVE